MTLYASYFCFFSAFFYHIFPSFENELQDITAKMKHARNTSVTEI